MKSCAFYPCAEVESCGLVGGCTQRRFKPAPVHEASLPAAKALNGTKARPVRDPARIKRRRKPIT